MCLVRTTIKQAQPVEAAACGGLAVPLPTVVPVLWPQLPGVLVRSLHVVHADLSQDLLQIKLEGG